VVKFDKQYWLGIQVGTEPELSPRIALTSVGYSFSSLRADTASVSVASLADTTWRHSGANIYRLNGNIGIGTMSPSERLSVAGNLEFRSADGQFNHVADLKTTVEANGSANFGIWTRNIGDEYERLTVTHDGNVGIGTTNPTSKLEVIGTTTTKILAITGGGDLAEPFEISESQPIPKGALVIIDEENPGRLKLSHQAYDKRVAGVVSGAGGINPGLTLTQEGVMEGGQNVALSGRVHALATAANGPIKPGDLLTTSDVAGHAMKATDFVRWQGAVIGKAMSALENGEGLVLVNLQ